MKNTYKIKEFELLLSTMECLDCESDIYILCKQNKTTIFWCKNCGSITQTGYVNEEELVEHFSSPMIREG